MEKPLLLYNNYLTRVSDSNNDAITNVFGQALSPKDRLAIVESQRSKDIINGNFKDWYLRGGADKEQLLQKQEKRNARQERKDARQEKRDARREERRAENLSIEDMIANNLTTVRQSMPVEVLREAVIYDTKPEVERSLQLIKQSQKPKLIRKVKSDSDWEDEARKWGFTDSYAVAAWLEDMGLVGDGKMGPVSQKKYLEMYGAPENPSYQLVNPKTNTINAGELPEVIVTTSQKPILSISNKYGGNLNKINYFQQGGTAKPNVQQLVSQLVQAAMQGDQQATETINKIMQSAQNGDQQAIQIGQLIQEEVKKLQGQATVAKWGSKLGYIQRLKHGKGGKSCPACEQKKQGGKTRKC